MTTKIKTHAQLQHELNVAKRARDEARAALKAASVEKAPSKTTAPSCECDALARRVEALVKQRNDLRGALKTYERDHSLLAARAVERRERARRHAAEAREQKLIETIAHMKNVQGELERSIMLILDRQEGPEEIRKARARAAQADDKVEGLKHGTTAGYTDFGCRCFACSDANRKDSARFRRQRLAREMAEHPDRFEHGKLTTYTMAGCRCSLCKEANRVYQQETRKRKREELIASVGA